MYWKFNIINSNLIPFKSKRILIHGEKIIWEVKFFNCNSHFSGMPFVGTVEKNKKGRLDKLSIGGLSVAIIGVVIVLISSIFV